MNTAKKIAEELEELELIPVPPQADPVRPPAAPVFTVQKGSSRELGAVRALGRTVDEVWESFQQLLEAVSRMRDAVRVLEGALDTEPQIEVVEGEPPEDSGDSDQVEDGDAEIPQSS